MPLTIGTLTSTVNVVDGNGALTADVLESIIEAAVARVRAAQRSDDDDRDDRVIPERVSGQDE